ncbi:mannosyl-oligosaccharide alpha-1,2-mannosidase 1B [Trichoderma asperellum]|uniref:alpha-1,2-Mannosidase n=1 Tax=Trichoderma asperellum TaxID=101201 RepID=A0A6V8R0W4_TRIAP|nr:mannosyl-oligosaccharide alpha-1,2-mannosidase 1B [Trichoderma asperellum]
MLSQLQGPIPRRYVALLFFVVCIALFLWSGFDIIPRRVTAPRFKYPYMPSSYDWSKAKIYHPPTDMKKLPTGSPKPLPKIQSKQSAGQDAINNARREAVKKAVVKSWGAYKQYAWTKDELMPLSAKGKESFSGWSAQLVDALDTLWIMGLKDDFNLAVKEVALIDWSKTKSGGVVNLFEVTIRYLGGLLAAYDLSQEPILLAKAVELGNTLYATFDTPNRLPSHWLDYEKAKQGTQTADDKMSGAAGGTLCMEFTRLAQITGEDKFYDAVERLNMFFRRFQNETTLPGMWPIWMNYRDEAMLESSYSIAGSADSQYEYLVKMHPLLSGLNPEYPEMAIKALDTIRDNLLFRPMTPKDDNILFAGSLKINGNDTQFNADMDHLTCFAGGMYALAGKLFTRDDYLDLGSRLTAGCVWEYDAMPSGIMPESATFVACEKLDGPCPFDAERMPPTNDPRKPGGFLSVKGRHYLLRPEAIESVFYMWRITGDQIWRDTAWRMWENVVRETETELAFAIVKDVTVSLGEKGDSMETFFIAETAKYYYLTFSDSDVVSLDNWVFNTEAHPFRRAEV